MRSPSDFLIICSLAIRAILCTAEKEATACQSAFLPCLLACLPPLQSWLPVSMGIDRSDSSPADRMNEKGKKRERSIGGAKESNNREPLSCLPAE